jgi:hypothetical protein
VHPPVRILRWLNVNFGFLIHHVERQRQNDRTLRDIVGHLDRVLGLL